MKLDMSNIRSVTVFLFFFTRWFTLSSHSIQHAHRTSSRPHPRPPSKPRRLPIHLLVEWSRSKRFKSPLLLLYTKTSPDANMTQYFTTGSDPGSSRLLVALLLHHSARDVLV
jgi:hypothetical protein